MNESQKRYYEKNKEKIRERQKSIEGKRYSKQIYQKHRDKIIQRQKKYNQRTNYASDKTTNRKLRQKLRWQLRNKLKSGQQRKPCFLCGFKEDLNFHHITYKSDNSDVIVVCNSCHSKIHNDLDYINECKEVKPK